MKNGVENAFLFGKITSQLYVKILTEIRESAKLLRRISQDTYRVGVMTPLPRLWVDNILWQQLPTLGGDHFDRFHNEHHLRLTHEIRQRKAGEAWPQKFIGRVLLVPAQVVAIQLPVTQ